MHATAGTAAIRGGSAMPSAHLALADRRANERAQRAKARGRPARGLARTSSCTANQSRCPRASAMAGRRVATGGSHGGLHERMFAVGGGGLRAAVVARRGGRGARRRRVRGGLIWAGRRAAGAAGACGPPGEAPRAAHAQILPDSRTGGRFLFFSLSSICLNTALSSSPNCLHASMHFCHDFNAPEVAKEANGPVLCI